MNAILNYIVKMIPYMLVIIPLFIVVRIIFHKRNHVKKVNWYHETGLFLYTLFIIGLASQAIITDIISSKEELRFGSGDINLIPFKVFFDTYREVFYNGNTNYFIINFLGNIIMFMPIGFCVPLLWKVASIKVVVVGFCSSLFIEISQLFLDRCTDVDDLILNTMGTALGLVVFRLLYRRYKSKLDKCRG